MLNICRDKGNKKCAKTECTQTNKTLKILFLCAKTYSAYLALSVKVSHHSPQGKQHFAFKLPISA